MKRTDYETLAMEEIVVEMENGFLAASGDKIISPKYDEIIIIDNIVLILSFFMFYFGLFWTIFA